MRRLLLTIPVLFLISCEQPEKLFQAKDLEENSTVMCSDQDTFYLKKAKTVHVHVALCDNLSQGIAPVPERIGNGNDPDQNLYWGCGYGIKRFYKNKIDDWELIQATQDSGGIIMERLVFKHKFSNTYLLADAYRGSEIQRCTEDFFKHNAGQDLVEMYNYKFGGASDLNVYVGHNPLMDFVLEELPVDISWNRREAMVFACNSQYFFDYLIESTGSKLILGTQQFMAPEAYSVHAAINAWLNGKNSDGIRSEASLAYHNYQRNCPISWSNAIFGIEQ
jgi:hypothetical protein